MTHSPQQWSWWHHWSQWTGEGRVGGTTAVIQWFDKDKVVPSTSCYRRTNCGSRHGGTLLVANDATLGDGVPVTDCGNYLWSHIYHEWSPLPALLFMMSQLPVLELHCFLSATGKCSPWTDILWQHSSRYALW